MANGGDVLGALRAQYGNSRPVYTPTATPNVASSPYDGPIDPSGDSFLDDLWDSFRQAFYYEPLAAFSAGAGSLGVEGGFEKAERIGQQLATDPTLQTSNRAGEIVGGVLGAAVQPAAFAAASAVSGPPGAIVGAGFMGAQAYGAGVQRYRQYKEQRGEEINPYTEKLAGIGFGAAEFMASRFGLKALGNIGAEGAEYVSKAILKRAAAVDPKQTAGLLRRLLTSETSARIAAGGAAAAGVEGAEEGVTEIMQNAVSLALYDDGKRENFIQGLIEGVPQAAVQGALVGPIAAGAAGAARLAQGSAPEGDATGLTERQQNLREAGVTPQDEYEPLRFLRRNFRSGGLAGEQLQNISRRQKRYMREQMNMVDQTIRRTMRTLREEGMAYESLSEDQMQTLGEAFNGGEVEVPAEAQQRFRREARRIAQTMVYADPSLDLDVVTDNLVLDRVKDYERTRRREKQAEARARLPEAVADEIYRMREHVDALSATMIEEGLISKPLRPTFDANLGIYARRSFAAIEEGLTYGEVEPEVVNRWRSFTYHNRQMRDAFWSGRGQVLVRREMERLGTDDRAEAIRSLERQMDESGALRQYFDEYADAAGSEILRQAANGFAGTNTQNLKITSTVAGILKKRQDLPKVLRDLMGEYNDPLTVYYHTVERSARLAGQYQMLSELKDEFGGVLFFNPKEVVPPAGASVPLEGGESLAMQPLDGMVTFPEVQEWFTETQQQIEPLRSALGRFMAKGLTASKEAATVGQAGTQTRNVFSMFLPMLASGHLLTLRGWRNVSRGFKAAYSGVWSGIIDPDKTISIERRGKKEERALLDYMSEMWELGIANNDPRTGELQDRRLRAGMRAMSDIGQIINADATISGARQKWRGIVDFAQRLYQAGDTFAKIMAYESEYSQIREAELRKPQPQRRGEVEIKREAAERARKTMFAYDELPKATDFFRQNAFIAPFVSFPVAVLRSAKYNVVYAKQDLADPNRRAMGVRRAMGTVSALYGTSAIYGAIKNWLNIDEEEEQQFRRFMAPWDKAAELVFTGKDEGKVSFINTSYMDPYGFMKKPFIALFKGAEEDRTAMEFVWQWLEPFVAEELLTQRLLDISRNADATNGQPIYNPQEDIDEIATDMFSHVLEALTPGTLRQVERLSRGVLGAQSVYGTAPDPAQEFRGFFGLKERTIDIRQALYFKAQEFARARRDASRIFTSVVHRRGRVGLGEMADARRRAEEVRLELWEEMTRDLSAARRLGLTDKEIYEAVTSVTGFGQDNAKAMLRGRYVPYDYNERNLERRLERVSATSTDEDRLRNQREILSRLRNLQVLNEATR